MLILFFILSHGQVSCLIINNQVSTAAFAVMLIFLSKYNDGVSDVTMVSPIILVYLTQPR